MKPLVSVITPYRNAKRFLPGFVESLRNQTAQNWICIMVDDGSSDGGPALLAALVADDPRFLLISNTLPKIGSGPASARNCGLSHVQTKYTAFCDVDDRWLPSKLSKQLDFHLENQLQISTTGYVKTRQNHPVNTVFPPTTCDYARLIRRNVIPMLTVLVDSELLTYPFVEIPHEDYHFWLHLFRANHNLAYGSLNEVLAWYQIHAQNLTKNRMSMPLWTFRVYRKLGYSRAISLLLLLNWSFSHISNVIMTLFKRVSASRH